MPVQIPESYRAYCTDRAVKTAVDHILESKKTLGVPADLEWADLPKFHKAVLSAHQVQCEFAIFLYELWDEIWQPAVERSEMERSPYTVADTQEYGGYALDTYSIWKNSWFTRVFDIPIADPVYVLDIGAYVDDENRVELSLQLWDLENKKDITNELGLGDWQPREDIDDDYVYSSRELAPIVNGGSIDLAPLHMAAAAALAAVESHRRRS